VYLSDYVKKGIPFYRSKEIIELSNWQDISEPLYISNEQYNEIKRKFPVPKINDILITSVWTIGISYLIKNENFYFKDGNLTWLREINEKVVNITFLIQWLKSNFFLKQIFNNNIWAVQKAITIDYLKKVNIALPNLINQQKIASILSNLDLKIELNNKINSELEKMAKTLYDYWFVQFDFPDENWKPYKTSGWKMIWSDELKREIPDGWEMEELDYIISKTWTWLNPRDNFKLGNWNNYYITIKNVKWWKIIFDYSCDRIDDEAFKIIDKRSDLQIWDILFTSIQPVWVTYLIHEKPKNWNINESVFTIRPDYKKITSEYLYMLLNSQEMKSFTTNVSAWSIHKWIRHTVLKTFKLAYCEDKKVIDNFSKQISPILKRIYLIDRENQKLAELRDFLLPMLMNWQLSVK
jgi:type I restriction enzyme S subunit